MQNTYYICSKDSFLSFYYWSWTNECDPHLDSNEKFSIRIARWRLPSLFLVSVDCIISLSSKCQTAMTKMMSFLSFHTILLKPFDDHGPAFLSSLWDNFLSIGCHLNSTFGLILFSAISSGFSCVKSNFAWSYDQNKLKSTSKRETDSRDIKSILTMFRVFVLWLSCRLWCHLTSLTWN